MSFNIKNILLGGIIFYVSMFVVSMGLGPLIHEGVLKDLYLQTNDFWRPELRTDPPDMAALMPRWITVGLLSAFLYVGIYDNIRSAFNGSGMVKGLKFGIVVALVYLGIAAGWSGIFDLPEQIWLWWSIEAVVIYAVGGMALGWALGKWGSD